VRIGGLAGRVAMVVAGSAISSVCYALTIRAGLGLGPLFVLQDGVSRHTGITIGRSVMLVGLALVLVALALRWRPGPGTIAAPLLGGALLDAVLPHLHPIHGEPLRLAVVVAASWVMALGGALMVRGAIGFSAYDGIMLSIHRRRGWSVARIRLGMEGAVLAGGWMLGGAVGVGTVATGLLIGPALQFWLRVVGALPAPALEPAVGLDAA
jgi:uncharacterized membrane protein YczE